MINKSSRSREEEELRAQLDALLKEAPVSEGSIAEEETLPQKETLSQEEILQKEEKPQQEKTLQQEETLPQEFPEQETPVPAGSKQTADEARESSGEQEPEKKDQPGKKARNPMNLLYDFIMIAGVVMLLGGGIYVVRKHMIEKKSSELYTSLENEFVTSYNTEDMNEMDMLASGWVWSSAAGSADGASSGTVWYRKVKVDLEGLKAINSDVAGWLFFENEQISYPVMFSGDDTYLYADLNKSYSTPGSLFLQGDNTPDFEDSLSVIYGHNMRNGTMFGRLKQYREDESYYQDHQYFQIFVGDKVYRYRVFAYFRIQETEVDMVNVHFTDQVDPDLLDTVYQEKMEEWEKQQTAKAEREQKLKEREEAEKKRQEDAIEAAKHFGISVEDYLAQHPLEEWEEPEEVEEMDTEWMSQEYIHTDYTFQEYLDQISERNMIETDIEVTTEDKIVELFTCSTHGDGKRFIIYGVRVDEHDFSQVEAEEEAVEFLDR